MRRSDLTTWFNDAVEQYDTLLENFNTKASKKKDLLAGFQDGMRTGMNIIIQRLGIVVSEDENKGEK